LIETQNLPCHFQPSAVRKELVEEKLPHEGGKRWPLVILIDLPSRHLHQLSVLDARWARSFASATIQAEVDVPHEALAKRQPALFHLNYLINPPAR
jgi:adenylate kinase family enzyme